MSGVGRGGVVVETLSALGLGLAVLGVPGVAAALSMTVPLTVVLDSGQTGDFGAISIEEKDGKLEFTIVLGPDLGPDLDPEGDLHELYFNLVDSLDVDDLEISHFRCRESDGSYLGSCQTDFNLDEDPDVEDGAGADFDFVVNFGTGDSKKGNGQLAELSFKLAAFADDDDHGKGNGKHDDDEVSLTIANLLETSETKGGIEVFFALHAEDTDIDETKSHSETVGAVPEPATAALFGIGLFGLAIAGRRRSQA
jgi:PEP-CTERM motif-containing protein